MIISVCEAFSSVWLCIVYQSSLIQVCVKKKGKKKDKKKKKTSSMYYIVSLPIGHMYGRDTLFP